MKKLKEKFKLARREILESNTPLRKKFHLIMNYGIMEFNDFELDQIKQQPYCARNFANNFAIARACENFNNNQL